VASIFHGHDHQRRIYQWKDIDVYDTPHLSPADAPPDRPLTHGFFVVHITDKEIVVVQPDIDNTWGNSVRKPLRK